MSKEDDDDIDDLGFDDEDDDLDLGDLDMDFGDEEGFDPEIPDDRNPVVGAVADTSKSFVEGFTDDKVGTLLTVGKNAIPKSLSTETGVVVNAYTDVSDEISKQGSKLKREAKRTLRTMKRFAPGGEEGLLAKGLGKLDSILGDDEETSTSSGPTRSERIAAELTDLLGAKQEETAFREEFNAQLAQARDKEEKELLANVAINTERSRKFLFEVTDKYQRTDIQISLRQLYAQEELVAVTKEGFDIFKGTLAAISKNTALPDIVKMHDAELAGRMITEKLMTSAGESLFKDGSPISRMVDKATAGIKDIGSRGVDKLQEIAGMTEEFGSMGEMDGVGVGDMVGVVASDVAKEKIGKLIAKYLETTTEGKDAAFEAKMLMADPEAALKEISKGTGVLATAAGHLRGLMGNKKKTVKIERLDPDSVTTFDIRTKDSINKVIPQLLAKIHNEVSISRQLQYKSARHAVRSSVDTSSNNELVYDNRRNEFTTKNAIKEQIDKTTKETAVKQVGEKAGDLVSLFNENIKSKLNKEEARAFRDVLIGAAVKDGATSLKVVKGSKFKRTLNAIIPGLGQKVIKGYNRLSNIDPDEVERMNSLMAAMANARHQHVATAKDLHKRGLDQVAIDAGLMTRDKNGELAVNTIVASNNIATLATEAKMHRSLTEDEKKAEEARKAKKARKEELDKMSFVERQKAKASDAKAAAKDVLGAAFDPDSEDTRDQYKDIDGLTAADIAKHNDWGMFKFGKYTGDGLLDQIAGFVHKMEYVLSAKELKKIIRASREGDDSTILKAVKAITKNVLARSKEYNKVTLGTASIKERRKRKIGNRDSAGKPVRGFRRAGMEDKEPDTGKLATIRERHSRVNAIPESGAERTYTTALQYLTATAKAVKDSAVNTVKATENSKDASKSAGSAVKTITAAISGAFLDAGSKVKEYASAGAGAVKNVYTSGLHKMEDTLGIERPTLKVQRILGEATPVPLSPLEYKEHHDRAKAQDTDGARAKRVMSKLYKNAKNTIHTSADDVTDALATSALEIERKLGSDNNRPVATLLKSGFRYIKTAGKTAGLTKIEAARIAAWYERLTPDAQKRIIKLVDSKIPFPANTTFADHILNTMVGDGRPFKEKMDTLLVAINNNGRIDEAVSDLKSFSANTYYSARNTEAGEYVAKKAGVAKEYLDEKGVTDKVNRSRAYAGRVKEHSKKKGKQYQADVKRTDTYKAVNEAVGKVKSGEVTDRLSNRTRAIMNARVDAGVVVLLERGLKYLTTGDDRYVLSSSDAQRLAKHVAGTSVKYQLAVRNRINKLYPLPDHIDADEAITTLFTLKGSDKGLLGTLGGVAGKAGARAANVANKALGRDKAASEPTPEERAAIFRPAPKPDTTTDKKAAKTTTQTAEQDPLGKTSPKLFIKQGLRYLKSGNPKDALTEREAMYVAKYIEARPTIVQEALREQIAAHTYISDKTSVSDAVLNLFVNKPRGIGAERTTKPRSRLQRMFGMGKKNKISTADVPDYVPASPVHDDPFDHPDNITMPPTAILERGLRYLDTQATKYKLDPAFVKYLVKHVKDLPKGDLARAMDKIRERGPIPNGEKLETTLLKAFSKPKYGSRLNKAGEAVGEYLTGKSGDDEKAPATLIGAVGMTIKYRTAKAAESAKKYKRNAHKFSPIGGDPKRAKEVIEEGLKFMKTRDLDDMPSVRNVKYLIDVYKRAGKKMQDKLLLRMLDVDETLNVEGPFESVMMSAFTMKNRKPGVGGKVRESLNEQRTMRDTKFVEGSSRANRRKELLGDINPDTDPYIAIWDDLSPDEKNALRSEFFSSPEYQNRWVTEFKYWIRDYKHIDPGELNTRAGMIGGALASVQNKLLDPMRKLRKEVTDEIMGRLDGTALKELTLDQEEVMRKEFYKSVEYQAGDITNFDDWLESQGWRRNGTGIFGRIKRALSPRNLLRKSRMLDRAIAKFVGKKVLGGAAKLPMIPARTGLNLAETGVRGSMNFLGGAAKLIGLKKAGSKIQEYAPEKGTAERKVMQGTAKVARAVGAERAADYIDDNTLEHGVHRTLIGKGVHMATGALGWGAKKSAGLAGEAVFDTVTAIPGLNWMDKHKRKPRDIRNGIVAKTARFFKSKPVDPADLKELTLEEEYAAKKAFEKTKAGKNHDIAFDDWLESRGYKLSSAGPVDRAKYLASFKNMRRTARAEERDLAASFATAPMNKLRGKDGKPTTLLNRAIFAAPRAAVTGVKKVAGFGFRTGARAVTGTIGLAGDAALDTVSSIPGLKALDSSKSKPSDIMFKLYKHIVQHDEKLDEDYSNLTKEQKAEKKKKAKEAKEAAKHNKWLAEFKGDDKDVKKGGIVKRLLKGTKSLLNPTTILLGVLGAMQGLGISFKDVAKGFIKTWKVLGSVGSAIKTGFKGLQWIFTKMRDTKNAIAHPVNTFMHMWDPNNPKYDPNAEQPLKLGKDGKPIPVLGNDGKPVMGPDGKPVYQHQEQGDVSMVDTVEYTAMGAAGAYAGYKGYKGYKRAKAIVGNVAKAGGTAVRVAKATKDLVSNGSSPKKAKQLAQKAAKNPANKGMYQRIKQKMRIIGKRITRKLGPKMGAKLMVRLATKFLGPIALAATIAEISWHMFKGDSFLDAVLKTMGIYELFHEPEPEKVTPINPEDLAADTPSDSTHKSVGSIDLDNLGKPKASVATLAASKPHGRNHAAQPVPVVTAEPAPAKPVVVKIDHAKQVDESKHIKAISAATTTSAKAQLDMLTKLDEIARILNENTKQSISNTEATIEGMTTMAHSTAMHKAAPWPDSVVNLNKRSL